MCRSSILPHAILTCAACHSKPFSIFMVVCIKHSQQHWVMKKTTRFGSKSDFPMRIFSMKWGKKMTVSKFSGFFPLDCKYAKTKPWKYNGSATMFQLAFIHCCKFILLLVRLHRANKVPISDEWFFSPLIDLCKFSTSTRNSQSNWRPKIKSYNEHMVVTGIWLKMGRLTRYTNTQFSLHFSCNFSVSRFFWWNTLY